MLDSRWLRAVMAVLTATWAPGHLYCCCAAQAAAAEGAQLCGVELAEPSSCCAGERALAPAPVRPMASGCSSTCDAPGRDEGCGCLHGPVDAPLPVAITLPGHANHGLCDLDLLLELPPALGTTLAAADAGRCCRGSPHGPPADTLLRQGCLLLI